MNKYSCPLILSFSEIGSSDSELDEPYPDRDEVGETNSASRPDRSQKRRKMSRSRSRSLTPPPTLSQSELRQARHVLQQRSSVRNDDILDTSAIDLTVEDEFENLDPELQRIKETVKQLGSRSESVDRDYSTEGKDEDPKNQVFLLVNWIHNPDDESPTVIRNEMEFPYPRVNSNFLFL